jgi:hypothetical protein
MTDSSQPNAKSASDIEREIDRTRVDLALTLDALERKLRARHLVEKGFDMFRDTLGTNDALNRGLDVVRANPVPVALIGIGAAWLIASNTNVIDRLALDERVEAARRRVTDMASDLGNRAGELASDVAGRVGLRGSEEPMGYTGNPMVDEAGRQRPDGWVHQVSDMAQGAWRSARDSGEAVLNRAGLYAGDGANRVADQISDTFQRHPLVLGSIGVMAGALIAAMLPMTRVEDEWFGDTRDALWHRAQEAGEQAFTQVRDAATRAVDAATDAATETVKSELDKSSQV